MSFSFGTPSLFGTPSTGAQPAASPFGAPSTQSPFGFGTPQTAARPAATTTPSLWGTPAPAATPSTNMFGTPGPSMTAMPGTATPGGWNTAPVKPTPLTPQQRIQSIASAYSPESPDCRFRHMMYNRVDPSEVDKYAKPANVNDRLWTQAVEANPDPTKLVPVQATGFQDLTLRIEVQDKTILDHQRALEEVNKFIGALQRKHDLDTSIKIEQYKQRHIELSHRILKLMKKMEVLRCKGYGISVDEELFRTKLENLQRELNQPNHFKGRLNELASLVRMQEDRPAESYETLDDDSLESIFSFLQQQKNGIAHLVNTVKQMQLYTSVVTDSINDTNKVSSWR